MGIEIIKDTGGYVAGAQGDVSRTLHSAVRRKIETFDAGFGDAYLDTGNPTDAAPSAAVEPTGSPEVTTEPGDVPPAVADAAAKAVGITYAGEMPIPTQATGPQAGFRPFPTMP